LVATRGGLLTWRMRCERCSFLVAGLVIKSRSLRYRSSAGVRLDRPGAGPVAALLLRLSDRLFGGPSDGAATDLNSKATWFEIQ
jgi:hypothetical protein